ncbi:MAG: hypothetical protein ACREMY_18230, partial [bacterium]
SGPSQPTQALGSSASSAAQPSDATASGPSVSIIVTGGKQLNATLPKSKCETTTETDGSASVLIEFKATVGQPAWDLLISVAVSKKATLDQSLTMSTDTNKATDPYQMSVNLLDANGSLGSGWSVGGQHGILLPGQVILNPDLSGSADVPMKAFQAADQLPDIHLAAHWTCK